jgi:SAM-dependent methyltransferase
MSDSVNFSIICVHDQARMHLADAEYACPKCRATYSLEEGVIRALSNSDEFYEGKYQNQINFLPRGTRWWWRLPLWLINSGYLAAVSTHVRTGATVLELGCAGGIKYFGRNYSMIGCDLSFAALRIADFYDVRIQADACKCIPLPSGSVDAIVSSYFWEHVPPVEKPKILAECKRVLKPDGKIVFLYDIETSNRLILEHQQRNPSRYRELFIDCDGHLGYESSATNRSQFELAGFSVVDQTGMEKTFLQHPIVYKKLAQISGSRRLAFLALFARHRVSLILWTIVVRIVDTIICPFLSPERARIEITVAKKP